MSATSCLIVGSNRQAHIADVIGVVKRIGFNLIVVADEVGALQALKAETFSFIVVDLALPCEEHLERLHLIEQLRRLQPACSMMMALTSKEPEAIVLDALKAGANDCVCVQWQCIDWRALLELRLRMWQRILGDEDEPRTHRGGSGTRLLRRIANFANGFRTRRTSG